MKTGRTKIGECLTERPTGQVQSDKAPLVFSGRVAGQIISDDMLDERMAIVGTAGSGKTYAAKGFVERLLENSARVAVVDPLGVWWGLRFSEDRQSAGFSIVVFGGRYGDLDITADMGAAVAKIVATRDLSCVIDLSTLPSGAARRRFMTAFAETLYELNEHPLHLVLDEADLWVPQRPMPDQMVLLNRVDEIVRRGRIRGFIPWLISQRPAVIHKDVLSQTKIMIAMGLTSSQDRGAIGDWIEGNADRQQGKAILGQLPRLKSGQGFFWAPGFGVMELVSFPLIKTFDSSKTPVRGQVREKIDSLPPIDLGTIVDMLRESLKADGQTQLKQRVSAVSSATETALRAEIASLREQIQQYQQRESRILAGMRQIIEDAGSEQATGAPVAVSAPQMAPTIAVAPVIVPEAGSRPAHPIHKRVKLAPKAVDISQEVSSAARALYKTLIEHYPARLSWSQVATLSGRKARGGQFSAGRKNLRDLGFIDEENDRVRLSDLAVTRIRSADPDALSHEAKDPAALLDLWCAKLPSPAPAILRELSRQGYRFVEPEVVAANLQRKAAGGQWSAGVAALRANGLVDFNEKSMRISPLLIIR